MAKQNIESTDNLNQGRTKINENFTELYDIPLRSGTIEELVTTIDGTTENVIYIGNPDNQQKRIYAFVLRIADPQNVGASNNNVSFGHNGMGMYTFLEDNQCTYSLLYNKFEIFPVGNGFEYKFGGLEAASGQTHVIVINDEGVLSSQAGILVPANGTEGQVLKWISGAPQWVTEGGG
jgi:hypothetical protein